MPSISPSSNTLLQFLNAVLSQRGPNPLPYEENLKWHIRQHLVATTQAFPGLRVKTAIFTHNDGRAVNLLQAHGTIPMLYREVKYNIPLTVWLLESYPLNPPLVYVTPTRDMIIKPRHRFVNASGLVSVGLLQQWIFPRCNLAEFVQKLSEAFGQDPPLYSKPSSPRNFDSSSQKADPPATALNSSKYHASSSLEACNASGSPRPRLFPPSPQHSRQNENSSEVFKKNAVNSLTNALQKDLLGLRKSFEVEMDELFKTQALLDQRSNEVEKAVGDLTQEKEGLEQQLQVLLTNADVLESWLRSNQKASKQVDIDEAFVPSDALSKQMLELRSSDLAIEDLLYSLDKAVQNGAIPMESYLKHVRSLSREQFFLRAASLKVRATQLQLQAFGSSSRVG